MKPLKSSKVTQLLERYGYEQDAEPAEYVRYWRSERHALPVSLVNGIWECCNDAKVQPESFFADCERLLKTQKQLILQGAPGTGKTFVAEKLATWWAGASDRTKTVQFHESYGYEDFVIGIPWADVPEQLAEPSDAERMPY
jgi:MoxR-like ATPase